MRESMSSGYDRKTVYLELLNFYTPFGWYALDKSIEGKRMPSPINKMYDGANPFSVEKQLNYFEDDVSFHKAQKRVMVQRSRQYSLNPRLLAEEYWLGFWLRRKYRRYDKRKKLVLKHRCRPLWGTLWGVLMLAFLLCMLGCICANGTTPVELFFASIYQAVVLPVIQFASEYIASADSIVYLVSIVGFAVFAFFFIRQLFEAWFNQFITKQILTVCVNAMNITNAMKRGDPFLQTDPVRQQHQWRIRRVEEKRRRRRE